jgi:hypothetical protein
MVSSAVPHSRAMNIVPAEGFTCAVAASSGGYRLTAGVSAAIRSIPDMMIPKDMMVRKTRRVAGGSWRCPGPGRGQRTAGRWTCCARFQRRSMPGCPRSPSGHGSGTHHWGVSAPERARKDATTLEQS